MKQYVLLNPGPACTSDRVKQAMINVGDVCPREVETGNMMSDISHRIVNLFTNSKDYKAVLLSSSGTGAVEMVISSLPKNARVLNVINGSYGERIQEMLDVYAIPNKCVNFDENLLDYEEIEKKLEYSKFTHISVVHCETTTGVINDLQKLSELARKHNCKLIVDAMSSAFAYKIDLDSLEVAFLCCSSNKLVQGMAGLGIAVCRKEELKNCHARTVYLDLRAQADYFKKTHQMRFTPPVQILSSLQEALVELSEEGRHFRFLRYSQMNMLIRQEMEKLGFVAYIPQEHNSVVITSFYEPTDFNFEEFHGYLKEKGFVIYPGKVSSKKTFRISNIGNININNVKEFIEIVKKYLHENNLERNLGR
jgi:2-aminoethylphosphonate-pyruvate transaminase